MPNRGLRVVIPPSLVQKYIKVARDSAKSPSEKAAVAEAVGLAAPARASSHHWYFHSAFMRREPGGIAKATSKVEKDVATWKTLILKQLYIALCTKRKYAKEVAALKKNSDLLIGAVAGYVASSVGVAVGVMAGLVAAFLSLVLKMGVNAFCEGWNPKLAQR